MSDHFENLNIDASCPNCNSKLEISTNSIGKSIKCPNCQQTIDLKDDGLLNGLNDANEAIDELFNTLDSFGK